MHTNETLKDLALDAKEDEQENGHCDLCDSSDRRYWGLCENCYDEVND